MKYPQIPTIRELILLLGGFEYVSANTDVKLNGIYKWAQRGSIPPHKIWDFLQLCRKNNLKYKNRIVTAEMLILALRDEGKRKRPSGGR